jgi:hypothetical protein
VRRAAVLAALLAAVAGGGCGGGAGGGAGALPPACRGAGFVNGPEVADGVFAARIPAACELGRVRTCVVADGHGPIAREIVPARVDQDCFAFNQYVGAGGNQIPGYASGECFGRALVSTPPRDERSTFRCDGGAPPSSNGGTRVRMGEPDGPARTARLRVPDPRASAPPWSLLLWHDDRGRLCYEPGQVVRGRADPRPGGTPAGPARRPPLVGSLRPGGFTRYDPRAGGSCGEVDAAAGLLVSWESRYPRRDLARATTIAGGVAGSRVRGVDVRRGGRWTALPLSPERAFAVTARGVLGPRALPLRVVYRDGSARTLG